MGKKYDLPYLNSLDPLVEPARDGEVEQRAPSFGFHSAPLLEVADWALRYTLDKMKRLIMGTKELPNELERNVQPFQPLYTDLFPTFLQTVWNSQAFQAAARDTQTGTKLANVIMPPPGKSLEIPGDPTPPPPAERGPSTGTDRLARAKKAIPKPPAWLMESKNLSDWVHLKLK